MTTGGPAHEHTCFHVVNSKTVLQALQALSSSTKQVRNPLIPVYGAVAGLFSDIRTAAAKLECVHVRLRMALK